jgi:hypothetical protein
MRLLLNGINGRYLREIADIWDTQSRCTGNVHVTPDRLYRGNCSLTRRQSAQSGSDGYF